MTYVPFFSIAFFFPLKFKVKEGEKHLLTGGAKPKRDISSSSSITLFSLIKHPPSFAYRLHRVQELGELVEAPWAGCGIFSFACNDTIEFLDVVHSKFIKEFLIFQPIHWNWCGMKTEWGGEACPRRNIRQSTKFSDHKLDPHPHREGTVYLVSYQLNQVCVGTSGLSGRSQRKL